MSGNRLTIVIEVPPTVRPELVDPHDVAEEVVEHYNERAVANGLGPIDFIAAEWGHQLSLPFT